MSLESHDGRDASELVLASLKLTDRLVGIVDSHRMPASANQQSVSSSVQGIACITSMAYLWDCPVIAKGLIIYC